MRAQVFTKVALFGSNGKVLLLKRSSTDQRRASEWDLAGGGVESGEDLAKGAAREVKEETGIDVDPLQLQLVYAATAPFQQDSNTRLLFVGKTNTTEVVLSHEHEDYRWVDVDTAVSEFPHPVYSAGLAYARDKGLLDQMSS